MSYTAYSLGAWRSVLAHRRELGLGGGMIEAAEAVLRKVAAALIAGEYRA